MNLQNATISINTLGDNTVITGVAGARIRIRRIMLVNDVATAQKVTIKSGASTNLSAQFSLPSSIGGGVVLADAPDGAPWWVLDAGDALVINLSAATLVAGFVQYTMA
jgi:hypothetical protein